MRVLVIGGNGFLGSHIVDELVSAGHEVSVFDRFSTSEPRYASSAVRRFPGDVMSPDQISNALAGQDSLVHALTMTTPATAHEAPLLDIETNITSAVRLLTSAVDAGVRRVLYLSSGGAVYGEPPGDRAHEDDPLLPVSPYGIGKLTIERYLDYFHTSHDVDHTVLRVANPYGSRQPTGAAQGLIPYLLRAARDGTPIRIMNDGSMLRDYVHAQDAARMIVRTLAGPRRSTYNIGSGTGTSVNQVIDIVEGVTGARLVKEFINAPKTYVQRSVLDTDRFADEFGRPHIRDLRAGIAQTWEGSDLT